MSQTFTESVGWTLFHFVWQGFAVAAALSFALFALRRHSANARYAVACLAALVLAACPVTTFLFVRAQGAPLTPQSVLALKVESQTVHLAAEPANRLSAMLAAVQPHLNQVVMVWLIGLALLALRMVGGIVHVELFRRRSAKPVSPEWQARMEAIAERIGLRRAVQLLESSKVEVPSAMGILKATIIIPCSALSGLSCQEVESLLAHELAHIRRHDYLVNLLQTALETALFYHPAVWWTSKVIRTEREHCCDDIAVTATGDARAYARALASMEATRTQPKMALAATGGSLMNRIKRILGLSVAPTRLYLSWIPVLFLLGVALLAGRLDQTKQAVKDSKGPDVEVTSHDAVGHDMHNLFQHVLDDPNGTVEMDGKTYKVKDLSPAQRADLQRKLDRAAVEVQKATREAMRAAHEALRNVFAQNGPFDQAMEGVRNMKITGPDCDAINKSIQEGMKESQAERERSMEEASRDLKEAMAEAQKEIEQSRKEMARRSGKDGKEFRQGQEDEGSPVDVDKILENLQESLKSLDMTGPTASEGLKDLPEIPELPALPAMPPIPPMPDMDSFNGRTMTPEEKKAFHGRMKEFGVRMKEFEQRMKEWGEKFGKSFGADFSKHFGDPPEALPVPKTPQAPGAPHADTPAKPVTPETPQGS